MKRWYGGTLIATLAFLLFLPYYVFHRRYATTRPPPPPPTATTPIYPSWTKKAHLIPNLQGLPDLYTPALADNLSDMVSRVTLLWGRMRPLLLRSDALQDTGRGVREAAAAWRDLVEALERERDDDHYGGRCPSFVTSSGGWKVEVPCGLVQDSAVTVVGVPRGNGSAGGEFAIELVGEEKEARPVVFRYLVRFGGGEEEEEEEEGNGVSQNSWTKTGGWGQEERCPGDASNRQTRVDGLLICNEQTVWSAVNKDAGASLGNNIGSVNKSTGSRRKGYIFPFIREQTFTATLWAGPEGFHMTVNGKHATSFANREGLDPWLVNEVKVAGDIELLSLIANGLPIVEDSYMVTDIMNLKAPPLPKKRIFLLIGVFSTANNFERRMALRRTWMQYQAVRDGDVAVRFFTGLHTNSKVNKELWREAQAYNDIQLTPFVDYYSLISLKTIAISIFGTKILPANYIMKTDDDAFVRVDEVFSILKKMYCNGLLYGSITFESEPHRDMQSKWYIGEEEWPYASYPPWAHGPGYIISGDIADFVVEGHQKRTLQLFKLEDVAMGIWIHEFKKTGKEVHYVNDDRFYSSGCDEGYILAHYQGPRLILCLWQKLQKEDEPICC